jgi:hypothetical protein
LNRLFHYFLKPQLPSQLLVFFACGRDVIKQLLYSIGDNANFLTGNRDPIDQMIEHLKAHFDPAEPEDGYSLSIASGIAGSRLTHNHARHYNYVLQSLTLWREVGCLLVQSFVRLQNKN